MGFYCWSKIKVEFLTWLEMRESHISYCGDSNNSPAKQTANPSFGVTLPFHGLLIQNRGHTAQHLIHIG